MNELQIFAETTQSPDIFRIYWRRGQNRCGAVDVDVQAPAPGDKLIIAELSALRYLLLEKEVAGHNHTGLGLTIVVSNGAIKKATHKDTEKLHLLPYANFLVTRFADTVLRIEKETDWLPSGDAMVIEQIVVKSPPGPETISIHGIGDVVLTRHALERYRERSGGATPSNQEQVATGAAAGASTRTFAAALKSLRKVALSPELTAVHRPQSKVLQQYLKHEVAVKILNHPFALLNFVVGKDHGRDVLITVFSEDLTRRPAPQVYRGAFREPGPAARARR